MKFIDEVEIVVKGGDGGDGCVAFRREKYVPRGGPSGGDGGNGGDVILVADPGLNTLLEFKYKPLWQAKRGEHGKGKDKCGKSAPPLKLRVPVGTVVYDLEKGSLIADLSEPWQEFIVAKGGKGGRGNKHFATPTNQAPLYAEPGEKGEEKRIKLVLKLIAEVGIIGMPNVGKSTFISKVSKAKPKIADYPFTTLVPNLGVVSLDEERVMIMGDMPGLIPGASRGLGLGLRFLKHVERCKVLLHLLSPSFLTGRDVIKDFEDINRELSLYSEELSKREQLVALNKADLPETKEEYKKLKPIFEKKGIKLYLISAVTGEGVRELLEELWKVLHPK